METLFPSLAEPSDQLALRVGERSLDRRALVAACAHHVQMLQTWGLAAGDRVAFKTELQNLPPERIRLREAITGATQRQLDASAFDDAGDLAAFLRGVGFDVRVTSQVDETPAFSTLAALDLAPAVIERLRPVLRVWVMTPASV